MLLVSLYLAANAVIIGAYGYIAWRIVPDINTPTWRNTINGSVFFITCALTHLELVGHVVADVPIGRAEVTRLDHVLIHVVQAVAATLFAGEFARRTRSARAPATDRG